MCIRDRGGSAINHVNLYKNRIGRNKKNTRYKKSDFSTEICTPVNKVFQPEGTEPVSYTHLDVYKRQEPALFCQYLRSKDVILRSSRNHSCEDSSEDSTWSTHIITNIVNTDQLYNS